MFFTAVCVFAAIFDFFLLYAVLTEKKTSTIPYVYLLFVIATGVVGKVVGFLMLNGIRLSQIINISYESYRNFFGKEITLLSTFAYLLPLALNCLMSTHRVAVFISPIKSKTMFSNKKLVGYSFAVTLLVLVSLLIPYFSACSLNFNAVIFAYESACAPGRHPITTFQNNYAVCLPLLSMLVNFGVIIYLKLTRKNSNSLKLEKTMLRQVIAVSIYHSIYEIIYQLIRFFPKQYAALPVEIQSIIVELRFSIVCLFTFLVYFVETRSTRELMIKIFDFFMCYDSMNHIKKKVLKERMLSEIPNFHIISQIIFCLLAFIFLVYDFLLFLMTLAHRKDIQFPFAYLIVMTTCGIVCKIAFITDFVTYLLLPEAYYLDYRELLGKEFTLLGTLTYFIPMFVSVLMTLNRLYIVLKPTDQTIFSQKRILMYSFGILTGCAPEKHILTRFTGTHLIWIPTTLLLINLVLIMHLKAQRHSVYQKMLQKTSTVSMNSGSGQLAKCQKKREQVLMRQALAITIYLSFYEIGTLLMKTFPVFYGNLPEFLRDSYFYFRLETICGMNFFVYFVESPSIRKMFRGFLGCPVAKRTKTGSAGTEGQAPKVSTITLRI